MTLRRFLCVLFLAMTANMGVFAQKSIHQQIDEENALSLRLMSQPVELDKQTRKVYELAKGSNYTKGQATAAKLMGASNYFQSRFAVSIRYYQEALQLFEQLNDTLEMAKAHLNIATSYSAVADYEKTMQHALLSLKWFEALGDINGEARVYNLMGVVSDGHGDKKKALHYLRQYLEKVKIIADTVEIATAYNNIGSIFSTTGQSDSAIYYLHLAEQMHNVIGYTKSNGDVYQNLGELYVRKKDKKEAFKYYSAALAIHKANGNVRREAEINHNLGILFHQERQLGKADTYFAEAVRLSAEVKDNKQLALTSSEWSDVKAQLGDYKQAYELQKQAAIYRDSVYSMEKTKSVQELQTRYETEQKENQIELLSSKNIAQELNLQQRNLYLTIAIILLLCVSLSVWLIYRNKKFKEAQLKKEAELNEQLFKAEAQNALQQDRLRISRELHDNIGANLTFIHTTVEEIAPEDTPQWQDVKSLVNDTITELRRTVWLINKPSVRLDEWLVKLREYYKKIDKVKIDVTAMDNEGHVLSSKQATALFRIIQEAVNNSMKYAEATKITITVQLVASCITICIEDNGKGFDIARVHKGFGLDNMQQHMLEIGGTISVDSMIEQGTKIALTLSGT